MELSADQTSKIHVGYEFTIVIREYVFSSLYVLKALSSNQKERKLHQECKCVDLEFFHNNTWNTVLYLWGYVP